MLTCVCTRMLKHRHHVLLGTQTPQYQTHSDAFTILTGKQGKSDAAHTPHVHRHHSTQCTQLSLVHARVYPGSLTPPSALEKVVEKP